MAFHDHIRGNAATVLDYPSMGGLELMGKRIRNIAYASVFVAMGIIDGLDATA